MERETKMIPIHTAQGDFKVWVQRPGNNPSKRLLLLHGGPGMSHEYFKSFEEWFSGSDIEYIYYDQLGVTTQTILAIALSGPSNDLSMKWTK